MAEIAAPGRRNSEDDSGSEECNRSLDSAEETDDESSTEEEGSPSPVYKHKPRYRRKILNRRSILVENFPDQTTENNVIEFFRHYGTIGSVDMFHKEICLRRKRGKRKKERRTISCARIEFHDESAARAAGRVRKFYGYSIRVFYRGIRRRRRANRGEVSRKRRRYMRKRKH